jgi:hypothetical protein
MRLKELIARLKTASEDDFYDLGLREIEDHGGNSRNRIYRYKNWIIKERMGGWATSWHIISEKDLRKEIRGLGLKVAKQWNAGRWIIQPEYDHNYDEVEFQHALLDLHSDNIGIRRDGQLVAFDW